MAALEFVEGVMAKRAHTIDFIREMHPVINKISLRTLEAQAYIDRAAAELRENALTMIRELPEKMQISGKATNAYIKNNFEECDFIFAMFVEKNKHRPGWLELGVSVMTSLMPLEITNFLISRPKKELLEYIEQEYTTDKCAHDLKVMMEYLYDEIETNFKGEF